MGEEACVAQRAVRETAHLSLVITACGGSHRSYAEAPWKVFGPVGGAEETPTYYLANTTAGILQGDHLVGEVTLETGARARILTPSATRVHTMSGGLASQNLTFRLEKGAFLDYRPRPLIPYAGASFDQSTAFELEQEASLITTDIITAGRIAHGERFAFDRLRLHLRITLAGRLIMADQALVEPARQDVFRRGVMRGIVPTGALALGTLCLAGGAAAGLDERELTARLEEEQDKNGLNGLAAGVTRPHPDLVVARVMATSSELVERTIGRLFSLQPC